MMADPDKAPLFVSRYRLQPRVSLNRCREHGRAEVRGALIRRGAGVGCLQPWPEFGDATLDEELDALRAGTPLRLGRRALECAQVDGRARLEGRSLFAGLNIPQSHATIPDPDEAGLDERLHGFASGKLKAGGDPAASGSVLERLVDRFPELRWRIDFNALATAPAVREWWTSLDPAVRDRIDFLEDPAPYDARAWSELRVGCGIPLAVDRAAPHAEPGTADVIVWKPAVHAPDELPRGEFRIVVTSSMDHAFGQCYAAFRAAELASGSAGAALDFHGLLTHALFEADPFFDRLRSHGPRLLPPEGTGLGFDDALAELVWTPL